MNDKQGSCVEVKAKGKRQAGIYKWNQMKNITVLSSLKKNTE